MPEHPTDAHFSFTFVFKQALIHNSLCQTAKVISNSLTQKSLTTN